MRRDILAVMQNQWFKDPERVERSVAKLGEAYRVRLVRYALFAGCKSGRVLRQVFGDLIERMEFEEASPRIGGQASVAFAPDPEHVRRAFERCKPDFVVCFGAVARAAVEACTGKPHVPVVAVLYLPHPTARGFDTLDRLRAGRKFIETYF